MVRPAVLRWEQTIVALVLATVVHAQDGQLSHRQLRNYSLRDGLVQSQVTAVHQDRNGFLWFGTAGGGISRFSGTQFSDVTTSAGLLSHSISAFLEDAEGALWIATSRGLSRLHGGAFQSFGTEDGLPDRDCLSLAVDRGDGSGSGRCAVRPVSTGHGSGPSPNPTGRRWVRPSPSWRTDTDGCGSARRTA